MFDAAMLNPVTGRFEGVGPSGIVEISLDDPKLPARILERLVKVRETVLDDELNGVVRDRRARPDVLNVAGEV